MLTTLPTIASIYTALAGLAFIFAPQAFGTGAVPPDAAGDEVFFVVHLLFTLAFILIGRKNLTRMG